MKMESHYKKIVKDTDRRVIASMQRQIMDGGNACYGGFWDGTGIVQAKYAIYQVAPMIAAYCCTDSAFYRSGEIFERIIAGLTYIRGVQHENGLFDYITCNFFSAPDTAFCLKKLLPVYEYLRGMGEEEISPAEKVSWIGKITTEEISPAEKVSWMGKITTGEMEILRRLEEIIKDGADGMLAGGFHTPNHRWAIASILMACSKYFGSRKMEEAANTYLKEGIDCNEDGEFSEKSAGNYNRINNDAMILLSQVTGDTTYEQHVLRNLRMMLTYIEPDGSIFTANSTRFDKDLLVYPTDYYMEYLRMGQKYNIPEFLAMCNFIFDLAGEKNLAAPDCLIWFMLCPQYRNLEFGESYDFGNFHAFYRDSGIVRGRNGRFTYTVMSGKSNFFYLHSGTIKLEVKVCGSFCEHRAFKADNIEQLPGGGYHLNQVMRGWYYLPFEDAPKTSDWWKMNQAARPKKYGPNMQIDVWVQEVKGGVDIRVKTSGVEGAPWRIELAFFGVNFLTSRQIDMPLTGSEVLVVKEGEVEVANGFDTLLIEPCFGKHHFIEGKEDSEKKTQGAFTLYLTDYTAFDREIHIRNKLGL
jgi:hypothetical protein